MTPLKPGTVTSPRRLFSPTILLLTIVLTGWSAFSLMPAVGRKLGVMDNSPWFIDSYAILASSDAVRIGLDPFQPNPLDIYHRPHVYSHWWFHLGGLALTRKDNFLLGGCWVLLFLGLGVVILRPDSPGRVIWSGMGLLSPPVLLAIYRANNDLVVFILLACGLLFLRETRLWRLVVFSGFLLLAAGLKFYPIIAAAALLLVRPPKLMLPVLGGSIFVGAIILGSVWPDFLKAMIPVPTEVYTFGAPIIFRDLGWTGWGPRVAGIGLLTLGALVCFRQGWSVGLPGKTGDLRARFAYACGALLLVGCFLAGISYSYRLIYGLLLLPWLWQQRSTPARWTVGLLLATLWLDGLYCLGTNIFIGPMHVAKLVHRQMIWRFLTQPIVWATMTLLAGSLLGMLNTAARDFKKSTAG